MRPALALALAAAVFVGCGRSSGTTSPTTVATGLSGSWSGCYVPVLPTGKTGSCSPVSMNLTESGGVVSGTAIAGNSYSMSGQLVNSAVTLLATAAAANENWTYTGTLSGDFISGKITYGDTLLPLQFARTH